MVKNASQNNSAGGIDSFLIKISPNGTLIFSTYLGGENTDKSWSISITKNDTIFIVGSTLSNNFPIYPESNKSSKNLYYEDAFITEFSSEGNELYSSYFGGSDYDDARNIVIDSHDNIVLVGYTESNDFPVLNAYQEKLSGSYDYFITKFLPNKFILENTTTNSNLTSTTAEKNAPSFTLEIADAKLSAIIRINKSCLYCFGISLSILILPMQIHFTIKFICIFSI